MGVSEQEHCESQILLGSNEQPLNENINLLSRSPSLVLLCVRCMPHLSKPWPWAPLRNSPSHAPSTQSLWPPDTSGLGPGGSQHGEEASEPLPASCDLATAFTALSTSHALAFHVFAYCLLSHWKTSSIGGTTLAESLPHPQYTVALGTQ